MSETQAIETTSEVIDETIVTETPEGTQAGAELTSEEIEIIAEGEEQPASTARPNGFKKRIAKLNGKIEQANTVADDATRRAQALEEENRLLRLSQQQGSQKADAEPDEDDFDTDAEYRAAKRAYEEKRIAKIADDRVREIVTSSQSQNTQAASDRELEENIGKHYERVETLKMSNYEALEDKAIDVLGNDFAKMIIGNTKKSHLIMGHLGANIGKAEKLKALLATNPVAALIQAVEIGETLSTRPKHSSTPDPETKLDPGESSSVDQHQQKLDKLREKAAISGDMKELLAFKKSLKASGINL